jgi:stage III sporulation protein AG
MNGKNWKELWNAIGRDEAERGTGTEPEKKDWFRLLFPILLLAAVIFLLYPNTILSKSNAETSSSETESGPTDDESAAQEAEKWVSQLEEALSHMQGAGTVKVVLSYEHTGETTILQDEEYHYASTEEADASGGLRQIEEENRTTQTVVDADGSPYVVQKTTPKIKGVLVLAEGASSAVVRQEIIDAVQALLQLPVTSIHVATYQKEGGRE